MKSFNITIGSNVGIIQADMINELIDRLLMQDIHTDGFEEITLRRFQMDMGVLDH